MLNKFSKHILGKLILILVLLLFSIVSCTRYGWIATLTPMPEDTPLSLYIIGTWHSIEVIGSDTEPSSLRYKIIFETDTIVKYIVIYSNNGTEGYTFNYNFITQDSIYIENKRIIGGETWLLERKDNNLIVYRTADNKTMTIVLEREK